MRIGVVEQRPSGEQSERDGETAAKRLDEPPMCMRLPERPEIRHLPSLTARPLERRLEGGSRRSRPGDRHWRESNPDRTSTRVRRRLHDGGFGLASHAELAADALLDGLEDLGVLLEELLRVLATLAERARRRTRTRRRSSRRFASRRPDRAGRPSREMPSPYITSNSASRNGGATLFLTIFTRVRPPMTMSPSLMLAMRRMSMRTEA